MNAQVLNFDDHLRRKDPDALEVIVYRRKDNLPNFYTMCWVYVIMAGLAIIPMLGLLLIMRGWP